MIQRIVLIVIIFFRIAFSGAQNLVNNPSFEDTVACPYGFGKINYSVGWYSPTLSTPDYYNSCVNGIVGVPQNFDGWELAKTGVAYAGIATSLFAGPNYNYREYIQSKLLDTLIVGYNYQVSFYVSLSDSNEYACNNMGVYFSTTPVSVSNNSNFPLTPQIANNVSTNPLTNPNGWTLISGNYIAAGGELYLTIGNFNDAATSDTVFFGGKLNGSKMAYYYIDDVKVWSDSLTIGINENERNLFNVYPNPSSGIFEIRSSEQKIESIELYTVYGRKIYSGTFIEQIDISDQPNGVYFAKVKTEQGIMVEKIVLEK